MTTSVSLASGGAAEWLWRLRRTDVSGPARTVVLLPHAGGSAQSYAGWSAAFAPNVDLFAAQYPGRGSRFTEPFAKSLSELAESLATALEALPNPLYVFGHSLGAVLGFEVAWRLEQRKRTVDALFASAAAAPHLLPRAALPVSRLDDGELVAVLRERGGMPVDVFDDPELLEMTLAVVRADFAMLERYRFGAERRRLRCPVEVFAGDRDQAVPLAAVDGWRNLSRTSVQVRFFDGGHFYYYDKMGAVADAMRARFETEIAG
jgi:pyochelin biosynthetic protein PchC